MSNESGTRGRNLRMLWSFLRPYRGVLLVGLLLGLGTTLADLATPMVTKWLLDGLGADVPIAPAVWLLAALLVAGAVLGYFQAVVLGRMSEHIVLNARAGMVRRLFRARLGELAGRTSGELTTRVTSDTVLLRETASSSVVDTVNGVVGLFGTLVLMATLDWVLLATTAGALLVVGVIAGLLMPRLAVAQRDAQEAVGRLGGLLEGALRAIRTVKTSRAEDRETIRVLTEARESARQSIRAVRIEAAAWTVTGAGMYLAILLVLVLGAWRTSTGVLPVSSLVAFLLYAFQIMQPVEVLTKTATQMQSGVAAAARIGQVHAMQLEQHDTGTGAGRAGQVTGPVLSFRGVTARYGPDSPLALNGIDADIPRAGQTAIVGPSGAGKTTIFSLMLRFLQPEDGQLFLDGTPFTQLSLARVRARIAYVEQDAPLVPGTLRENVTYTHGDVGEEAIWRALHGVRLDDKIRAQPDGLDTHLSATTLSGGERQRIALARALARDPEILLLDEATAQLDGITESAVQEAIRRIAGKAAVVTIAHRLSTVIDADHIIVLDNGTCRATGTHPELLETDTLYQQLVAALRITDTAASKPNTPATPAG